VPPIVRFVTVLRPLDRGVLRLLRTRGHPPPVERALVGLSRLGEHGGLWLAICAAGAVVDPARRPLYARAARAVLAAYAANQAIKVVVRRRRPVLEDLPPLTSTVSERSYPSAHAATSFAAARVLGGPFYALACVLALSRPYLGVHYPSDALAGAVLGTAVAELVP
jgi:decaprenylphosphoryl-5-phosphoribose phosphatase